MKTDRFIQGILVGDDDELFSYPRSQNNYGIGQVVKRLKKLRKNVHGLKYFTQQNQSLNSNKNKQAVFSKNTVAGDVDEAISDVWYRLRSNNTTKHDL